MSRNVSALFPRPFSGAARFYSRFQSPEELSSCALNQETEVLKKQMLWRSRQRGLLELDVILGSFADKNLKTMSAAETAQFGEILAVESPDLYKVLSRQTSPSAALSANPVFARLLAHVHAS